MGSLQLIKLAGTIVAWRHDLMKNKVSAELDPVFTDSLFEQGNPCDVPDSPAAAVGEAGPPMCSAVCFFTVL